MNFKTYAIICVIIVVAAILAYCSLSSNEPTVSLPPETDYQSETVPEPAPAPIPDVEEEPETVAPEPEVATPESTPEPDPEPIVEPQKPAIDTPESLNDSDALVVSTVAKLSPQLTQWLLPEEQVRKWVLAVDQMAAGKIPQQHLPLVYGMDKYKVTENGETSLPAPENQERLTALIDAVTEVDPQVMAEYYRAWLPTLEQAYGELGKTDTFDDRVSALIERLEAVEPTPGDVTLDRPHVFYEYADPELENRSALEKWVWRMGNTNREKLQSYLDALAPYLQTEETP